MYSTHFGMLSSRFGCRLVSVSAANTRFGLLSRPFGSSLAGGTTMATMPFAGCGHPKPSPLVTGKRLAIGCVGLPRRRYTCDEQPEPPVMDDSKSQNIFQRFRHAVKKYRYVVVPVHMISSAAWFVTFYFVASSRIDVPGLLESSGCPGWIVDKARDGNPLTGHTVIAYGLYKIFTPVRYMFTLAGVCMTVRRLRKLGYVFDGSGRPKKCS